jgi:hypothetical protein
VWLTMRCRPAQPFVTPDADSHVGLPLRKLVRPGGVERTEGAGAMNRAPTTPGAFHGRHRAASPRTTPGGVPQGQHRAASHGQQRAASPRATAEQHRAASARRDAASPQAPPGGVPRGSTGRHPRETPSSIPRGNTGGHPTEDTGRHPISNTGWHPRAIPSSIPRATLDGIARTTPSGIHGTEGRALTSNTAASREQHRTASLWVPGVYHE